jgi:hypothetical protein
VDGTDAVERLTRPAGHTLAFSLDPSKAALTRLAEIAFV